MKPLRPALKTVTAMTVVAMLWSTASARAQQVIEIVVPNLRSNVPGNSGEAIPFAIQNPARYQQVYRASEFSAISRGAGWIEDIAFRSDSPCLSGQSSFGCNASNVQVNLSTTIKQPDALSLTFAENVGGDQTVVFGPAPFQRGSLCVGGPGPESFQIHLRLTTLFYYNPSAGNLLLDIRNFRGCHFASGNLDAENALGDSVSSIYTAGSAIGGSAGSVVSRGFITKFFVRPAPEISIALQSTTNVLLRWPGQNDRLTLEQSPALGSEADWEPAGGILVSNGPYKEVIVPLDPATTARFFRLAIPERK